MEISKRKYTSEIKNFLNQEIEVSGWVHEVRNLGNLKFIIVRDKDGFVQACAKKGVVNPEVLNKIDSLTRESVVLLKGILKEQKNAPNGYEIIPNDLEIISAANTPLPLDVTEKVDASIDTRLDNRFMDLRKPESAAIFKLRDKILESGRKFLRENKFIEIHTPKIIASASEGGTELFPIAYFDKEAFLAQSPQLYKQMMMATGFDRVFETAIYFRAEPHDTTRHLNEITAFDCEMAFIDNEENIKDVLGGLFLSILKAVSDTEELKIAGGSVSVPESIRSFTYDECIDFLEEKGKKIPWGVDIDTEGERMLGDILKEKFNCEIYFITKYPLKIKPFYTAPENFDLNDKYSRSFDLEYRGVEISSGGQRIHKYDLLVNRMKSMNINPENFKFYLDAFRYGMPPHGGFGLGIDRMLMQMLNTTIKEVVLFPRDRHRLTP